MNLDRHSVFSLTLIIALQSLSWQPLIVDLQGAFTARLNARRESDSLIY